MIQDHHLLSTPLHSSTAKRSERGGGGGGGGLKSCNGELMVNITYEGNEHFAECRRQCARVTSALQPASSEWDLGIRDSGCFEWSEAAATAANAAGSAPKHRMAPFLTSLLALCECDVPRLSMGPK